MAYNLKSIKEEFKSKGIFYTPPELAQLYKQAGNSIVVNVLERILENLLKDGKNETKSKV